MADIRPFGAIRPQDGMAAKIAALPYDVYNREEAKKEVEKNPFSFLKIDRPETQFPDETDMYGEKVYKKAQETLWKMLEDGYFCQDTEKCFYIYELSGNGHVQTGVAACASVDDYLNQVIKRHENTKPEKEADRVRHVEICQAQTGPIFLAHRPDSRLERILETKKKSAPVYDFVSEDQIRHRVWIIYEAYLIEKLTALFQEMGPIYIADGHHRAASAVKVCQNRRKENPWYTGKEPFNYFLCVLFPSDQLCIYDYNRVARDLNGYTEEAFLEKAGECFYIEKKGDKPYRPEKKGQFGMYLGKQWYALQVKEACRSQDPVEGLDVSILQNCLLAPILGIQKPGEDKRIRFVGGIRGLEELERQVREGWAVAFALYPTSMEELMRTADQGRLMPPKSTWFEPKLRSGLFIHRI